MATVRIADEIHPKEFLQLDKSQSQVIEPLTKEVSNGDGIYNIRSGIRTTSQDQWHDEDPGLRKEGDFKTKQVINELPVVI
jgi:hypothetical protein